MYQYRIRFLSGLGALFQATCFAKIPQKTLLEFKKHLHDASRVNKRYNMLSSQDKEYISSLTLKCESGDVWAMKELASFYYGDHPEIIDNVTIYQVAEYYAKAAS